MSELTVKSGTSMATNAIMAMETRKQIVELEAQEALVKDLIKGEAMHYVTSRREQNDYVSIIRIIPDDSAMARVELRISNGALNVSDTPKLQKLFGSATDELFEKDTQIGAIDNPADIIGTLEAKGIDPWTVLGVFVKPDAKAIALDACIIPHTEVLLPKKGFLDKLCELGNRLSEQARVYINAYLQQTVKPTVVLNARGKKE